MQHLHLSVETISSPSLSTALPDVTNTDMQREIEINVFLIGLRIQHVYYMCTRLTIFGKQKEYNRSLCVFYRKNNMVFFLN